jgi:hypothetical protein
MKGQSYNIMQKYAINHMTRCIYDLATDHERWAE